MPGEAMETEEPDRKPPIETIRESRFTIEVWATGRSICFLRDLGNRPDSGGREMEQGCFVE